MKRFQLLFFFVLTIQLNSFLNSKKFLKDNQIIYDDETDTIILNNKVYIFSKKVLNTNNTNNTNIAQINKDEDLTNEQIYTYCGIIAGLTIVSGLMSGFLLGLLSIDKLYLELKASNGTKTEKKQAERLLPLLAQHHWLLVTLLVVNASVTEAMPLFLHRLVPEYLAIILSVILVLFFGEIIPQSICTGKSQLKIAYAIAPVVNGLMIITSPISYPISRLLDCILGTHAKSRFQNRDLKALIELHTHNALNEVHGTHNNLSSSDMAHKDIGLDDEQARLMIAAIELKEMTVADIMVKLDQTYMLKFTEPITKQLLDEIITKNFSKIPVYHHSKSNVIGILNPQKILNVFDPKKIRSLKQMAITLIKPLVFSSKTPLIELLKEFKKGGSKLAVITEDVEYYRERLGLEHNHINNEEDEKDHFDAGDNAPTITGIVTLSDFFYKIASFELIDLDETTRYNVIKRTSISFFNSRVFNELSRNLHLSGDALMMPISNFFMDSYVKKPILANLSYGNHENVKNKDLKDNLL